MVDVIIAACGGAFVAGVFSLIQFGLTRRAQKAGIVQRTVRELETGVQILLYDRIKYLAKHYMARGDITADELEDLLQMHSVYHNELHGNGYLDALMEAVQKLPIKGGRKK